MELNDANAGAGAEAEAGPEAEVPVAEAEVPVAEVPLVEEPVAEVPSPPAEELLPSPPEVAPPEPEVPPEPQPPSPSELPLPVEEAPPAYDADEDAAATRVQAAMRGRNAREQISRRSGAAPSSFPPPVFTDELPLGEDELAASPGYETSYGALEPPLGGGSGERPSRIARPALVYRAAAPAGLYSPPDGALSPQAMGALGSPSDSMMGAGGGDLGGFCSEAEFDARMSKIRRLKLEAEARRKKEHEVRVQQEEAYRRQIVYEVSDYCHKR